jgi:predicted RecB family nuclease
MKAHKFIGPYAKAEVGLVGWIDQYTQVGGRADLIIRRDDSGLTILDGKNTKRKDPDPDQLRWYALLFKLSYKQVPERIGFVWYRFPYNEDTGESGVEWVPFTDEDLEGIAQRVVQARLSMRKGKFDPTPTPTNCKYCDFETVCEARKTQREFNAARRRPKEEKPKEAAGPDGFGDLIL